MGWNLGNVHYKLSLIGQLVISEELKVHEYTWIDTLLLPASVIHMKQLPALRLP